MNRQSALAVASLVGSTVFAVAGALLIVVAFGSIGRTLYSGQAPVWTWTALWLVSSYVASGVATWLASEAGMRVSLLLRRSTLESVLRVDPDVSRRIGSGHAQSIAFDTELVGSLLVNSGPALVLGLAQTGVGLGVLVYGTARNPELGVCALALAAIAATSALLLRSRNRWSHRRGEITDALIQRLLGLRTVSIQESPERAGAIGAAQLQTYQRASSRMDAYTLVLTGSAFVFSGIVLLVAAKSSTGADVAINVGGALLAGSGLTKLCLGAADGVNVFSAYRRVGLLRLWGVEDVPDPEVCTDALLEARGVAFAYDSCGGLTHPISLAVQPGGRVLVSGDSGSGKTTLGEMIAGRRAPTSGVLAVAEGTRIARVPQAGDDHIFHASLLFNVLCGEQWPPTDASAHEAFELLHELGLGAVLARMPSGMAQPVGEGGWRLSAGEAARVSLARALLCHPDVLVLDETTAPLDPVSRKLVLEVAERYARALVAIAHP